ncbi:carbohydrate esterase family 5 protein [Hyaloscypha bicolor E]|uniref:Cutinase n=1 Tax=Hyaloscypha bicolor E TaxID=1095630 RepID=A0A2J6SUT3_9HELO|nr:carbohydrate esterase family 5 protein [Hyaloscypha bicolor E]PMD54538.1 carbohydrate esterase family 5 protein [Hyaloscypha bicolor E]
MKLSFWTLLSLVAIALASPVPNHGPKDLVERETALNAFLTVLLDYLPALDGTISAVAGVLTVFENLLALLTGEKTTYNELGGTCKTYTVIFARGTTEPGNVGILVGPPFFDALRSLVGTSALTIQGVNNYSASIDGYLEGGDPAGSAEMAIQIEAAYEACPKTKLVASGYSQGGQVVHNAIGLLPATVAAWISKVVIFGDPDDGQALPNVASSKVDVYCHDGDNICVNGDLILPAHLTYGINAAAAAAFVAS